MKLVSYTDMRKSIGFDAGVQQEAIEQAIEQATPIVASDLRIPDFAQATYTDKFLVSSAACLQYSNNSFRTRLAFKMGFIVSVVSATWKYGSFGFVSDNGVFTPEQYTMNMEKGCAVVTGVDLRDAEVDFEYLAGFEPADDDATLYDQTQVPAWLQQLAIIQATILLDSSNPTLRHEKDAGPAIKEMKMAYDRLSASKLRYFPSEVYPVI